MSSTELVTLVRLSYICPSVVLVGFGHQKLQPVLASCLVRSNNEVCSQEFNPNALRSLMDSSAQLRSRHLDMQFMRRRRQKNPLGASRQWFVNADLWLAGTAAAKMGGEQQEDQLQVNNSC